MLRTSGFGSLSPRLVAVHSRAGSLLSLPRAVPSVSWLPCNQSFGLASGVDMSLPARGSAPCSTSGRGCHATFPVAGSARSVRRRAHVRCCAQSGNSFRHDLNARRPLDSIDHEWRALNQDKARAYFPSHDETSMWDMIDVSALPSNQSDMHSEISTHLDIQNRFWEHHPSSSVNHWDDFNRIHVILFGVGEGEPEGIYSLRAMPGADQLPQETIIAFEDAEDAQRYASRLEATMDRPPNVVPITPSELLEFCLESGYNCRLEQGGSMLCPPDFNVDVTDWERSLRLRNGMWSVVDDSVDQTAGAAQYNFLDSSTMPHNNAMPNDGAAALEDLRGRLEKLMQL